MNKRILLLIAISFCITPLFAKHVDINTAKTVAANFYTQQYNSFHHTSLKMVAVSETFEIKDNGVTVFYAFNMANNGFIMVAADDIVRPVLGYSFESTYSDQNMPPQLTGLISNYKKQITTDVASQLNPTLKINDEWARLNKPANDYAAVKNTLTSTDTLLGPLTTSLWDQGCCYNMFCPYDVAAKDWCSHCVTGCTATAIAQVMYYWRYPLQGQGSHTDANTNYGTLSANFGATNYNWDAMTDACTGTDTAIATLIYHCGIAVDMDYGPNGSSAWPDANTALVTFFNYSPALQNVYKTSYSDSAWSALLISELEAKRPIIYAGFNTSDGHCWVCDGYQGSGYFHFNWGWSGSFNGYYTIANLNPDGLDFVLDNEILYDIYPASGYPYYCSDTTVVLTSPVGTIEDGSGPMNYQNNDNCSWLISPAEAAHINISFDNFCSADSGDVLTIYDGPNDSAPILKSYSVADTGSAYPHPVSSTSPSVFLKFTTNGSGTASGWKISYTTSYPVYCSGVTTLTAPSDTFSDGSGSNNYFDNLNCRWMIQPPGASTVTLHFLSFNTEPTYDIVKVADPVSATALGTFSGTTIPPDVTSTSGQMLVQFTTNATNTAQGWSAYYTSTPMGVEEYYSANQLTLYPNPVTNILQIETQRNAIIEILNIQGQLLTTLVANSGKANVDVSSLSKGVYIVKLTTKKGVAVKRFIKE
jgi:hypothetical protein